LGPDLDAWDQFGWRPKTPIERTSVKTTTLDAIVRENGLRSVVFIKLDTQGTELDILRGGPVTVKMAVGMRSEYHFIDITRDSHSLSMSILMSDLKAMTFLT
jgi:FkbM family methyltransferase